MNWSFFFGTIFGGLCVWCVSTYQTYQLRWRLLQLHGLLEQHQGKIDVFLKDLAKNERVS